MFYRSTGASPGPPPLVKAAQRAHPEIASLALVARNSDRESLEIGGDLSEIPVLSFNVEREVYDYIRNCPHLYSEDDFSVLAFSVRVVGDPDRTTLRASREINDLREWASRIEAWGQRCSIQEAIDRAFQLSRHLGQQMSFLKSRG
jgi:hypothetical protein